MPAEPGGGPAAEPPVEPSVAPPVEPQHPARLEADEVPGLIRLTLTTAWRTLAWTTGTALNTCNQMLARTLNGEPPVVIVSAAL